MKKHTVRNFSETRSIFDFRPGIPLNALGAGGIRMYVYAVLHYPPCDSSESQGAVYQRKEEKNP